MYNEGVYSEHTPVDKKQENDPMETTLVIVVVYKELKTKTFVKIPF